MSDPLETVTVGKYTAVDYGGSIAEILTMTTKIDPRSETSELIESPVQYASLYNLRTAENFGIPLGEGLLLALLNAWVITNASPDERASIFSEEAAK